MWTLAALVAFGASVQLLNVTGNPRLAAGVFATCRVLLALMHGGGPSSLLITAIVASALGFGYFWLMDRVEGSGWWWVVLVGGAVLLI